MLETTIDNDAVLIGDHCRIRFMRTLRIPDDGRDYPLPPGLGTFPVLRVEDYIQHVPDEWRRHGGVFIPMYQREALWIDFTGSSWKPHAAKVGVGKVNALTGEPWDEGLSGDRQDYVVMPDQPWLDGINAGHGVIRQFIAMPLGMGYTVEGQLTGAETTGGIQLLTFAPKQGRFTSGPRGSDHSSGISYSIGPEIGLGAGGRMRQAIYPDPHGVDTWDEANTGRVFVHIANSMMFREITGHEPPPTPVSARSYTEAGLPWFGLYDQDKGDLEAPEAMTGVKTIKDIDDEHGFGTQQDDEPINIGSGQTKTIANQCGIQDGDC